jgi:hypothetical protein
MGGVVATGIFAPSLPAEAVAFWTATVLIDTDHYLDFVYYNRCRDLSIRGMFRFHRLSFQKIWRRDFLDLSVFHTAEFFLGLYLLATWAGSSLLLAALLGAVFHLALDVFYLAWYRSVFKRAYSVVEYLVRRLIMIRRGDNPDRPFLEALDEMGVGKATVVPASSVVTSPPPAP